MLRAAVDLLPAPVKTPPPSAPSVPAPGEEERFRAAVDYTWSWFALHSGQRMQMINFLIISLTVTTAAYATAMSQKKFGVASAIALGGFVLAALFQRLDVRTRELVQVCEPALKQIEDRLSKQAGIQIDFVSAIEKPAKRLTTYRVTLRILTATAMLFFLVGAAYALSKTIVFRRLAG